MTTKLYESTEMVMDEYHAVLDKFRTAANGCALINVVVASLQTLDGAVRQLPPGEADLQKVLIQLLDSAHEAMLTTGRVQLQMPEDATLQ